MAVKIVHKREKCIGCGACAAVCPEQWEMGEDGKSNLKNSKIEGDKQALELEKAGNNKDAAESCPMECIVITEE